jgi:hypothetical protein
MAENPKDYLSTRDVIQGNDGSIESLNLIDQILEMEHGDNRTSIIHYVKAEIITIDTAVKKKRPDSILNQEEYYILVNEYPNYSAKAYIFRVAQKVTLLGQNRKIWNEVNQNGNVEEA